MLLYETTNTVNPITMIFVIAIWITVFYFLIKLPIKKYIKRNREIKYLLEENNRLLREMQERK